MFSLSNAKSVISRESVFSTFSKVEPIDESLRTFWFLRSYIPFPKEDRNILFELFFAADEIFEKKSILLLFHSLFSNIEKEPESEFLLLCKYLKPIILSSKEIKLNISSSIDNLILKF